MGSWKGIDNTEVTPLETASFSIALPHCGAVGSLGTKPSLWGPPHHGATPTPPW